MNCPDWNEGQCPDWNEGRATAYATEGNTTASDAAGAGEEEESESDNSEWEEISTARPGSDAEPTVEVNKLVKKLHVDSGHKPVRTLVRALSIAGAPASVLKAARTLRCDACRALRPPSTRRRAGGLRPKRFNEIVHGDLVQVEDAVGEKVWGLNLVDAATGFQLVVRCGKRSQDVTQAFDRTWGAFAGPPAVMVLDLGPEFSSEEFADWGEFLGTRLLHTPVEAPWQNAAAERGGQDFKAIFKKVTRDHGIAGKNDVDMAFMVIAGERNEAIHPEAGVSASQAVFGRARRDPTCLIGQAASRFTAAHSQILSNERFARNIAVRETARQSLTRLKFSSSLRRAELD